MNQFNDQQIRDRLLHRLDAVQSDGIDECLFTDETFADRVGDVRYDLLDDYARGNLSADERALVERHLLSTPTDRHALRVAAALAGIGRAEHRGDHRRPHAEHVRSHSRTRRVAWFAAALAIGAVALLSYDRIMRRPENPTDISTLPTMTLLASAQRGDGKNTFDLPAHAHQMRLQVEVDAPTTKTRFTVSIADSGHVVFTARGLEPRTSGPYRFVEIALPAPVLGPGNRHVTLTADEGTGADASTWDITVNKTD